MRQVLSLTRGSQSVAAAGGPVARQSQRRWPAAQTLGLTAPGEQAPAGGRTDATHQDTGSRMSHAQEQRHLGTPAPGPRLFSTGVGPTSKVLRTPSERTSAVRDMGKGGWLPTCPCRKQGGGKAVCVAGCVGGCVPGWVSSVARHTHPHSAVAVPRGWLSERQPKPPQGCVAPGESCTTGRFPSGCPPT